MELLQKYAYKFFPATKYMNYAVKVEAYTLGKAANLVLNVDGCIGALFLDLLNSSSQFTPVSFPLSDSSSQVSPVGFLGLGSLIPIGPPCEFPNSWFLLTIQPPDI